MKHVGRYLLVPLVLASALGLGLAEVHARQASQSTHQSLAQQVRLVNELQAATWSYRVVERGGSFRERCDWADRALTAAERAHDVSRLAEWRRVRRQDCALASGPDARPRQEIQRRPLG